ncbi:MAG: hypothetical protein AAF844_04610 [Pseudomonadota bacterium]
MRSVDGLVRRLTAGLLALVLLLGSSLGGLAVAMPGGGAWAVLCGGGSLVFMPIGEDEREVERDPCPAAALSSGLFAAPPLAIPLPGLEVQPRPLPAAIAATGDRRPAELRARAPPTR